MAAGSEISPQEAASERVAILLATWNGEAFLNEQIRTLERQTHPSIDIWASDDGSTDRTVEILKDWQGRWIKGAFHISSGPGKGFAENFRALICGEAMEAEYLAFCDQDDIWEPHKIETALAWMRLQDRSTPLMFCSRTLNVSETGETIGISPLFRRQPSFRNAVVQSLAGGNTMVLNRSAWQCVKHASQRAGFVSHDWWTYQVVTGIGGLVRYSEEPLVRYRQHAGNLVGANVSWSARLARMKLLLDGQLTRWNDVNLDGLERNRDMLTADALATLELFGRARKGPFLAGLASLARSGVYRQTPLGTLAMWVATALGRM